MTNDSLTITGRKVAAIIEVSKAAIKLTGITPEELTELYDYNRRSENVGHIFDPTGYRELLQSGAFKQVAERIKLITSVMKLSDGDYDSVARSMIESQLRPFFALLASQSGSYEGWHVFEEEDDDGN